jgi:hypothetical protein
MVGSIGHRCLSARTRPLAIIARMERDAVRLLTVRGYRGSLGASGSPGMEVAVGTTLGQRLVVVWLVLTGASTLLYADFVSLPPLSERPVPLLWWAVGAVTLAAAVGVLRRATWGRLVGIGIAVFSALFTVWPQVYWLWAREEDLSAWLMEGRWLVPAITLALAVLALWWLVARWPPTRGEAV